MYRFTCFYVKHCSLLHKEERKMERDGWHEKEKDKKNKDREKRAKIQKKREKIYLIPNSECGQLPNTLLHRS